MNIFIVQEIHYEQTMPEAIFDTLDKAKTSINEYYQNILNKYSDAYARSLCKDKQYTISNWHKDDNNEYFQVSAEQYCFKDFIKNGEAE